MKTYTHEAMLPFDALRAPLWVFDLDHAVKWWANLAAVTLWGATDREQLLARNTSQQMSEATRTRLAAYRRRFERDEIANERWTFYPDGQVPVVAECTCSGIFIDDGDGRPPRLAMLVEARPLPAWESDPLERRSVEALRHVGEPVSLYSPAGAVLLRNPAALRAFGDATAEPADGDALAATFVEREDAAAARAVLSGEFARFDARLRTAGGERVHSLEVRRTLDPITGKDALLVCSRDLSDRLAYEQALEHGQRQLAMQAEELARLAAPVLRVWSQILVLPLIGSVDRERMSVALSALLPRIAADHARTVIFDLTGAAFVDVETVDSLQRALQVLKLQGCVVAVAGILPELARLLVAADARLAAPVYQTTADALRALIPRH